jgi:hypothetical protein
VSEPFRISNSKSNTYLRCPRKFEFTYHQKLKPIRTPIQLYRGDWIHQLMMTHYDGEDWRVRHAKLTAEFLRMFEEEREEYGDLPGEAARIMGNYVAHYKREDSRYRVLDSELDELVPLPNGDTFNFIIDLVIEEDDGGIWLWDHKTVAAFAPAEFLLLDSQLARYAWGAKYVGYPNVRGVLLNEVCTKAPTIPETGKTGKLTQRKNLASDARTYLKEIKRLGQDPNDYKEMLQFLLSHSDRWFRRTRIPRDPPMVKQVMRELMMTSRSIKDATERGHFPRAVTKQCQWDCSFVTPCIIDLQGGDPTDAIRLKFKTTKREDDLENKPTKLKKGK